MTTQFKDADPEEVGPCPYLGLKDDRDTALLYPSNHNCCYRIRNNSLINLIQQRRFCLVKNHLRCPLFKATTGSPVTEEIIQQKTVNKMNTRWIPFLGGIFLIVSAILASRLLRLNTIPEILTTLQLGKETQAIEVVAQTTGTAVFQQPTVTPTSEVQPTQTNTPVTPTAFAPHLLETPIGHNPQLILHRVNEGEGFIVLANTYNTSPDAIKAVNLNMVDFLYANQVIVIPYNTSDVAGLPAFLVFEILEEDMTIETVADELVVDIDELIKYNDLFEGYRFSIGEWLLIPR